MLNNNQQNYSQLLRLALVSKQTAMPKSSVYAAIAKGLFTSPIKLGERASAWLQSEVTAIINARIAGKSNDEIKALVLELEAERKNAGANV
jgi:prophage regulatory protein